MHYKIISYSDTIRVSFLKAVQQLNFSEALNIAHSSGDKHLFISTTSTSKKNMFHLIQDALTKATPRRFNTIQSSLRDPNSDISRFLNEAAPYIHNIYTTSNILSETPTLEAPFILFRSSFTQDFVTLFETRLQLDIGTQENNKFHTAPLRSQAAFMCLKVQVENNPNFNKPNGIDVLLLGPGIRSDYSPEVKQLLDIFKNINSLTFVDKHTDVLSAALKGSPNIPGYYDTCSAETRPSDLSAYRPATMATREIEIAWSKDSFDRTLEGKHDLIVANHILSYPFEVYFKELKIELSKQSLSQPVNLESLVRGFLIKLTQSNIQRLTQFFDHLNSNGVLFMDTGTLSTLSCPFLNSAVNNQEQLTCFLRHFLLSLDFHIECRDMEGQYMMFTKCDEPNPYTRDNKTKLSVFNDYIDLLTQSYYAS